MTDWSKLIAEAREATSGPWVGLVTDEICTMMWHEDGDQTTCHVARYDPTTVEKMLLLCQAVENELHHRTTGSAPVTLAGVRDEMYAALNAVKEALR